MSAHLNRRPRLPARKLLLGALLAGVACCALAIDPRASRLYEDALMRFERKDLAGAVIQLKNALQIDRNLLPVHALLGRALLGTGDVVGAEVAFGEALRLGANRAEVVVPLAQALMGQGKRQALLDDPRFAMTGLPAGVRQPLLLVMASAHGDLGRHRDALRLIEEARAIDPASLESWLAEVPVRIRARQFAEAAAAADRARALQPRSSQALYLRGSVAHAEGKLPQAVALYNEVLALDPNHLEALLARAGVAVDQNRIEEARRDITQARRVAPTEPRALYLGAVLDERQGNAAAAKAALAEITALIDPIPVEFLRWQQQVLILNGLAHHGLGATEKAKPYFEMIQRDQPGNPVSKVLGQIHLTNGQIDRAITVLDAYLRSAPTDPQALSMLASAHMSQGRYNRAAQVMSDALKVQDKPALRTLFGLSLLHSGKLGDATVELEQAWSRDPGQVSAGSALVGLYLNQKQTRKAIDIAELLTRRHPKDPGLLHLLGQAQVQAGNTTRARAVFEQAADLDPGFFAPRLALARLDAQAGKFDAANTRLVALLVRDDKNTDALMEAGALAEMRGRSEEATRYYAKAADHAGLNNRQPAFALFEYHLRSGRLQAAAAAAQRLAGMAPDDVQVLLAQARVAMAQRDTQAARGHLLRASRSAAFDADQQVKVALLQISAGDARNAAYSLSKALQSEPGNLSAQALLTDAELQLGEVASAEQRARSIQTAHPQRAVGHALVGDVAAARGQFQAAAEAYRRAHQIEPSSSSAVRLHRAMTAQDPAAAMQVLVQWLKQHPQDVPARRALADAHARAGNWAGARVAYEQLLRLAPNNAEALNNYAHVLLALRDGAGASRAATQALSAMPDAPHIIGTAGWVAYKVGETDRGLQLLRDARVRDPANADTRYYLAAVLAATGRFAEAREELQSALSAGTAFASARDAQELLQALK